jgi:hypothetical protein
MSYLLGLITGLPEFLKGILAYLNKKEDTTVAENGNSKDVSIAIVQSETARTATAASVLKVAMDHPVFWIAWSLGVFPVMGYYASIFWVSTFPMWGWTVKMAPADALEFGRLVTGSMFSIAGVSSVVAGIAHAWSKRT